MQKKVQAGNVENERESVLNIKITRPSDGASVAMSELVRGIVSDPELRVYILVHPLTTNLWWVQNIPTVGPNGKWQALCYFGTKNMGIGEPYEIMAIIAPRKAEYKPGDTLRIVSSGFLRSKIITVKRQK